MSLLIDGQHWGKCIWSENFYSNCPVRLFLREGNAGSRRKSGNRHGKRMTYRSSVAHRGNHYVGSLTAGFGDAVYNREGEYGPRCHHRGNRGAMRVQEPFSFFPEAEGVSGHLSAGLSSEGLAAVNALSRPPAAVGSSNSHLTVSRPLARPFYPRGRSLPASASSWFVS